MYCFSVVNLSIQLKNGCFCDLYSTTMSSFGKRLRECREAKGLSQQDLGKLLDTSYTVIGKYERDEMKPSIDVANKLAKLVGTTIGYLLGESKDMNILKDPAMLKRLILYTLDALIKNVKLKSISEQKNQLLGWFFII